MSGTNSLLKLYTGTPFTMEGDHIRPTENRTPDGEKSTHVCASPHKNCALAYAFKPNTKELARVPLIIAETLDSSPEGQENKYTMIVGAAMDKVKDAIGSIGHLYSLPLGFFSPVSKKPDCEHISKVAVPLDQCEHEEVKLVDVLGKCFEVFTADPASDFGELFNKLLGGRDMAETGRPVTDQATIDNLVSDGSLFKVLDSAIKKGS